jgi:glycosyltransferase involved in cell wall biosynthesis
MKPKVSVYIIAFNEAEKIAAAIESVGWADEIILADSWSTDGTTEIAERLGASVVHIKFDGYGKLRNEAIKACTGEWIFSLDADERCTKDVELEIKKIISDPNAADVYFVPRKNYFMGRWIRYSGWYPNFRQPQLFRNGSMIYDELPVHEGYVLLTKRPPRKLQSSIWQIPFKDVGEILRKADKYSALGAQKITSENLGVGKAFVHGIWAFIKHYIFKRGFLDGGPGLVIAVGNFEGTFYRYLRAYERSIMRSHESNVSVE